MQLLSSGSKLDYVIKDMTIQGACIDLAARINGAERVKLQHRLITSDYYLENLVEDEKVICL